MTHEFGRRAPLFVDEPPSFLVSYRSKAEYLSWLEDPAHTRGVVGSSPTSATKRCLRGSLLVGGFPFRACVCPAGRDDDSVRTGVPEIVLKYY